MGCNCGSKSRATASGTAAVSGTFRVMVNDHKVYETTNATAADQVASRYKNATILKPGETA
jgi:hypothetical protein